MTWLTVDEAATAAGVTRRTIHRWMAGGMMFRRTRDGIRVDADAVHIWRHTKHRRPLRRT